MFISKAIMDTGRKWHHILKIVLDKEVVAKLNINILRIRRSVVFKFFFVFVKETVYLSVYVRLRDLIEE